MVENGNIELSIGTVMELVTEQRRAIRQGLMATEEPADTQAVALTPEHSFCMCETYLRATERAALAGARWLGRADQESAEEAAFSGMEAALESCRSPGGS